MKKRIMIWMCLLTFLVGAIATPVAAKKKIKLNSTKRIISVGEEYKLKVKGTSKKAKWSSSNKKVATVSKKTGKKVTVTGKKKGKATITAKVGKKKLTCKITVIAAFTPGATAAPDSSSGKTDTKTKSDSSKSTDSNSLMDSKTDTTTTNDEGWVPGWY